MDTKYSKESLGEVAEDLRGELDSAEIDLLLATIFRLALEQQDLTIMTYGEILEDGKEWKEEQRQRDAEQKALQEEAMRKEEERIQNLQDSVMVTCFKKGAAEVNYREYITYGFAIQNKSTQGIRAVRGEITFPDLFDEEISTLRFTYDDPIDAGATVNWDATTEYNQYKDDDVRLKNKDLENLKFVWKPIKIIFQDGTTLE